MAKILACEDIGYDDTFDIEVDHEDHQFYLSNGTLTSNSHAVAYAIGSFQCAYLQTYYEPEWLCAYIETQLGDIESRSEAIATIKSFGYRIDKVDINLSNKKWTIGPDNKSFIPSFLTVNGIGDAAINEIIENRPYESIKSMLWDDDGEWRHSKLNRSVLERLIKLGAFQSMDVVGENNEFKSYKQMYDIIIGNYDDIKKKPLKRPKPDDYRGKALFDKLLNESEDNTEWSNDEFVKFYEELIGQADTSMLVDSSTIEALKSKGIKSIDDLTDQKDIAWFILQSSEKKTTKNGKPYEFIKCIGESGKEFKLFCWGATSGLKRGKVYVGEISTRDGMMSVNQWRLREIA